jgi:hypothetical protein
MAGIGSLLGKTELHEEEQNPESTDDDTLSAVGPDSEDEKPSASARMAEELKQCRKVIVRKGHERPKTGLTKTGARVSSQQSGIFSSGLWFDTQTTSATAAPVTSDCETSFGSGRSDSEFDDDWLGWKPTVPRDGEA